MTPILCARSPPWADPSPRPPCATPAQKLDSTEQWNETHVRNKRVVIPIYQDTRKIAHHDCAPRPRARLHLLRQRALSALVVIAAASSVAGVALSTLSSTGRTALTTTATAEAGATVEPHYDNPLVQGLSHYLSVVNTQLDLPDQCYALELDRPIEAYIPLATRLPRYPDYDAALTWDEIHGWHVATETTRGQLTTVAYLGSDILPSPHAVAYFANSLLAGTQVSHPFPHPPAKARTCDLARRLAAYTTLPGSTRPETSKHDHPAARPMAH